MTVAYDPRRDWRREDRAAATKPVETLAPFWAARITGASDEVLMQWLNDSQDSDNTVWRDAVITETVNRWYVSQNARVA